MKIRMRCTPAHNLRENVMYAEKLATKEPVAAIEIKIEVEVA